MNEFENALAEVLEVETISHDDVLQSFECWDSLTILSILALADSKYKVSLTANEVVNCGTIGRLITLVEGKSKNRS